MKDGVKVITISGNGTNCEMETAFAFRLAGADVSDIVHISRIVYGEVKLDDYHILALAGGFLDGDDLGAAKAMANRLKFSKMVETGERLIDSIMEFVSDEKLIIGICNGFQLMVKLGLLPAVNKTYGTQSTTITYNDSGRFEDRWVYLHVDEKSPSVFTKGITDLYLPVRHGEGKFVAEDKVLDEMEKKNLVIFRYSDENYNPTMEYPKNPNGSFRSIAGISDESGRLMALMPHPEGFMSFTQHPRWTREYSQNGSSDTQNREGKGLLIFKNGVRYVRENLL
ncbi:MAG: phosphoribosylformylglycinamidine synthase subunit PurQ [Deltaproteobacteria bacterium]|uniref:Phosphoribosylformylglycinamidine synthase subunit PurQ n=1 Tax=Candidatus Zymogenus saltonus TaxID=2844893 RepID=A0A9D8KEZ7_9DELT|nr:phosphoribosylformylglycinamidine synthase subunit PurQ [Candidatus Zymogenus saltonus]